MIDMEQLIADRDAGTDGPWRAISQGGSSTVTSENEPKRNDTRIPAYAYRDEHCIAYPFIEEDLRCRWDFVCFSHADARRIARLPDLETAFIEAVAVLEGIAAEARVSLDKLPPHGSPNGWRDVAVERIDIARAFLTRHNITNETALARAHVAGMGGRMMRISLDVQDAFDADMALKLAKESLRNNGQEFGYWNDNDPAFSAFVRKTKTGVSVKTWRK